MERMKVCPKCGGGMEVGFMPGAPYWKPGKGLLGLTVYRIFGYRCKKCGYVEFYAEGGII